MKLVISGSQSFIGRELIRRTQELGGPARIILLSAPKAVEFYPRVGLKAHPSAWTLDAGESLG